MILALVEWLVLVPVALVIVPIGDGGSGRVAQLLVGSVDEVIQV